MGGRRSVLRAKVIEQKFCMNCLPGEGGEGVPRDPQTIRLLPPLLIASHN